MVCPMSKVKALLKHHVIKLSNTFEVNPLQAVSVFSFLNICIFYIDIITNVLLIIKLFIGAGTKYISINTRNTNQAHVMPHSSLS